MPVFPDAPNAVLLEQYREAIRWIRDAGAWLDVTTPSAAHYRKGMGGFGVAMQQHQARVKDLRRIESEMLEIVAHLEKGE